MKAAKQRALLDCLQCGKYRVNAETGKIESFRKAAGAWQPLRGTVLPDGYRQLTMFAGRGTATKVQVYEHVAVFIAVHGPYAEGLQVDHENRQRDDNRPANLRLTTPKQNISYSLPARSAAPYRRVTVAEQQQLRAWFDEGIGKAEMSRRTGLSRPTVHKQLKSLVGSRAIGK